MIFTWTWGHTSKSLVDVTPTPPNAQGALRIQKLLHFTERCGNPPPSWRGIKPLQHWGGEQEPQLGFLEHSFSSHLALYLQSLTTDTLEVNHVRYSMVAIVNTVLYI